MIKATCALLLSIVACAAHADFVISSSQPRTSPGSRIDLTLTMTNDSPDPLAVEIPSPLHLRFDTGRAVTTLDATPDRQGAITIPPNQFATVHLQVAIPGEADGWATLTATGFATNTLALQIEPPTRSSGTFVAAESPASAPAPRDEEAPARLVDKPPPLAISLYEPVYFIVGGDGGLNAKFQISFRYRLFDGKGPLANRLPWIDDLYLAFSQTSLWNLGDLSKPFRDSSYRPRLFYSDTDLARLFDGRLRLGFEAGIGHESNGKDGDSSRSFNMLYVRPTLAFGDPEGFNVYLAPLAHNYLSDDENPDLKDYRGYVDWIVGAGSKGGLNFWSVFRKGERSTFGSAELNLSFPLSKLSSGDLTGWLMLQYFGGYGESLLDYNKKLDSQLRLGIAVAL